MNAVSPLVKWDVADIIRTITVTVSVTIILLRQIQRSIMEQITQTAMATVSAITIILLPGTQERIPDTMEDGINQIEFQEKNK